MTELNLNAGLTPPAPDLETTATWTLNGRTVVADGAGVTITGGQTMNPTDAALLAAVLLEASAWVDTERR